jgi:hypothetical protein
MTKKKQKQEPQTPKDIDAFFVKEGWDPKQHDPDSDLAKRRRKQRADLRRPDWVT